MNRVVSLPERDVRHDDFPRSVPDLRFFEQAHEAVVDHHRVARRADDNAVEQVGHGGAVEAAGGIVRQRERVDPLQHTAHCDDLLPEHLRSLIVRRVDDPPFSLLGEAGMLGGEQREAVHLQEDPGEGRRRHAA